MNDYLINAWRYQNQIYDNDKLESLLTKIAESNRKQLEQEMELQIQEAKAAAAERIRKEYEKEHPGYYESITDKALRQFLQNLEL